MHIPFLSSFHKKTLEAPSTVLIDALKKTAKNNNFYIFQNIILYHHKEKFLLPLIIIDKDRGIFLFEHKDWSYDDLKNATIQKASKQKMKTNTLSFENTQEIIQQKFNEITHTNGVPLFNYLLMENLTQEEYKKLNAPFQELLPQDKVIFNGSLEDDILEKMLQAVSYNLPTISQVASTLFIQYAIVEKEDIHLASPEQQDFIQSPLLKEMSLIALNKSGKTSSILLKAILEKLKNPKLNIVIIKPNILSCDLLKSKLLDTVEHAIVDLNPTQINIITPQEFIENTPKSIDLLICDDFEHYEADSILKFKKTNPKYFLCVKNENKITDSEFTQSFCNYENETLFYKTNQHAKALQLLGDISAKGESHLCLVLSTQETRENLKNDLEYFVTGSSILLDTSKNLIKQNLDGIILCTYDDIPSINHKYLILMDIDLITPNKLEFTSHLCSKNVYILYDKESENLSYLRNKFEDNKND